MSRFFDLLVANEVYADIDFIMSPQEDGKTETFYLQGTLTSLTVDWGDGTQTTASTTNSHTYTSAGDYRVRVLGDCRAVTRFACASGWVSTKHDMTRVNRIKLPNATSWAYSFFGAKISKMPSGFSVYRATDLRSMFNGSYITTLPSGFSCPNATNTSSMFEACYSLVSLPDSFACPNTTNTYGMFYNCRALTYLPNTLSFAKSTNVRSMFTNCSSLVWTPKASEFWERQSPQVMYDGFVFYNCPSLTNYADIPTAWKDRSGTILYQPPNE